MKATDCSGRPRASRRDFLRRTTAAMVGGAVASGLRPVPGLYAAGSDAIKVGLIGCGGRGTGAADNVLSAAPGVEIVAMADVFKDRLDTSLKTLKLKFGDKVDVPGDRQFVGVGAFQHVLDSGVNYVILATPPGFRPWHLKASVAAGKHIFTEKPVAVDGPGFRMVLEAYEEAKTKGLSIVAGTQRRHQTGYLETIKRIHDGAIGDLASGRVYYNTGALWVHPRQTAWTDLEYQLRNWYYFTWLCGDHIVEQHVHDLDVMNWVLQGHPTKAVGVGGRQVRTGPDYGNIFDHFAIDYEFEKGVHVASMCRQMPNCEKNVSQAFHGTRGFSQVNQFTITGEKSWQMGRDNDDKPYVQEHADLIASIRAGKPVNELRQVAESSLAAIMGRMAAYTGQAVTWQESQNSQESLMPVKFDWGAPLAIAPVAMPGQTKLV